MCLRVCVYVLFESVCDYRRVSMWACVFVNKSLSVCPSNCVPESLTVYVSEYDFESGFVHVSLGKCVCPCGCV